MSVYNVNSERSQTSANLNFSTKLHFLDGIPLAYTENRRLKICLRSKATSQIPIYTPEWRETLQEKGAFLRNNTQLSYSRYVAAFPTAILLKQPVNKPILQRLPFKKVRNGLLNIPSTSVLNVLFLYFPTLSHSLSPFSHFGLVFLFLSQHTSFPTVIVSPFFSLVVYCDDALPFLPLEMFRPSLSSVSASRNLLLGTVSIA